MVIISRVTTRKRLSSTTTHGTWKSLWSIVSTWPKVGPSVGIHVVSRFLFHHCMVFIVEWVKLIHRLSSNNFLGIFCCYTRKWHVLTANVRIEYSVTNLPFAGSYAIGSEQQLISALNQSPGWFVHGARSTSSLMHAYMKWNCNIVKFLSGV